MQAKGRLQPWNRAEGLVAAAPKGQTAGCPNNRGPEGNAGTEVGMSGSWSRDLEGFKGFKRLKPGKRQA